MYTYCNINYITVPITCIHVFIYCNINYITVPITCIHVFIYCNINCNENDVYHSVLNKHYHSRVVEM